LLLNYKLMGAAAVPRHGIATIQFKLPVREFHLLAAATSDHDNEVVSVRRCDI
jgi:hypothetical protein